MAERRNSTLVECARSMLYQQSVPQFFWAEADLLHFESGLPRPQRHMKCGMAEGLIKDILGCSEPTLFYAHVPAQQRSKLDATSTECCMLGYSSVSKAYRLFDLTSKKIIESGDVHFYELKKCNWTSWYNTEIDKSFEPESNLQKFLMKEPPVIEDVREIEVDDEEYSEDDDYAPIERRTRS